MNPTGGAEPPSESTLGALIPTQGWLAEYLAYTRETMMAPIEYQLATGLACVSAAIGRGVWFPLGENQWTPHIWITLIGHAGLRKSSPIRFAEKLIRHARSEEKILPGRFSPEAFYQHLSENSDGFWNAGELEGFLSGSRRDYMSGVRGDLCDLWDGSSRKIARVKKTWEIHRPAFTAMATARPSDFEEAANSSDFRSGFLSRWLLVSSDETPAYRGLRAAHETASIDHDGRQAALYGLQESLGKISVYGASEHPTRVAFEDLAITLLDTQDEEWQQNARTSPEELSGWASRRGILAMKLSVLSGLSRHSKPIVDAEDAGWAIDVVQAHWQTVQSISLDRIGMSRNADRRSRVLSRGRSLAGPDGWLTVRKWHRLCQRQLEGGIRELTEWIGSWEHAGELERSSGSTTAAAVRFRPTGGDPR